MRPSMPEVIDGISRALIQELAPELRSEWAKKQGLFIILSALEHLKLRLVYELDMLAEENADLAELLQQVRDLAVKRGLAQLAKTASGHGLIDGMSWADPLPSKAVAKLEGQNSVLRASLDEVLTQIDDMGPETQGLGAEVRELVYDYFRRQAQRYERILPPIDFGQVLGFAEE